jgi:hypothetical protein
VSASGVNLELALAHGRTGFEPGSELAGVAAWSGPAPPRGIELRLSWTARGHGGRDRRIVEIISFPAPRAVERRPFWLTLPAGPYSFVGTLVSLSWWLELVCQPGEAKATIEIAIAPGREPLVLEPGAR